MNDVPKRWCAWGSGFYASMALVSVLEDLPVVAMVDALLTIGFSYIAREDV